MTSQMERLDKRRAQVRTRSGPASYIDTGGPGRPALFVHGVGSSSYLWRHVVSQLEGQRDLLAVEPALGRLQVPTLIAHRGATPPLGRPSLVCTG
jgi:hypothetical protein